MASKIQWITLVTSLIQPPRYHGQFFAPAECPHILLCGNPVNTATLLIWLKIGRVAEFLTHANLARVGGWADSPFAAPLADLARKECYSA